MIKPAPGWEGSYDVTETGEVFSLARVLVKSDGSIQTFKQRKMSQFLNCGYVAVRLSGPRRCVRVHRLVAIAFIDNPNRLPEVNHKDGDRSNPHISNLEWVTSSENRIHAVRVLGSVWPPHPKGEDNGRAVLSVESVMEIRRLFSEGKSGRSLAAKFGVGKSTIMRAIHYKSWSHVKLPEGPKK